MSLVYHWAGIPLLLFIISFHHRWDAVAFSSALGGARRGGRIAAEAGGRRGHGGSRRQEVPPVGPAEGGRKKTAMVEDVRLSVIEGGSLLQEEGEVTGRTAGVTTEGGSTAAAAVEELGAQAAAAAAACKPGCIRRSLRGVLRRSPSWALLLVGASASLRRRHLRGSSPLDCPNLREAIDRWSIAHQRALLPHAEFSLSRSTRGELTAHLPAFSMAATAEAAEEEGLQVNHTPHRYQLGRGAQQLAAAAAAV